MNLQLTRYAYLNSCTLGWLTAGDLRLATIERPWLPNPEGRGGAPEKSCIPDGHYEVLPHHSGRYPNVYALRNEVLGVYHQQLPVGQRWGRVAILIHNGNWVKNVIGCIAVGLNHGSETAEPSVIHSMTALNRLRTALRREKHQLLIRPHPGTLELVA